ncbi:hypothetical protein FQR65_LT01978 [Abscondita terminalis]|nr:hypothetical protein FQR65_LT01978 [Abscondita terminalis]
MASIQDFSCEAGNFATHILFRQAALEGVYKKYHLAALVIQSAYRGYRLRKEIRRWHQAATILQKYIRRWLVLWHLPKTYKEYYEWFCASYYHKMATRIQALWRGYWYRKDRLSPKELLKRKRELEELIEKNKKAMVSASQAELERMGRLDKEAERWVLYILFKLHHHLRTYVTEGIYSTHNSKDLSSIEQLLKALPLYHYMANVKKIYNQRVAKEKSHYPVYMFKKHLMRNFEDAYRSRDRSFEKKCPMSDTKNEKPFVLIYKKTQKPYEKSICNDEKYCKKEYRYRDYDPSKNISDIEFDLMVQKKLAVKERPPPYYLDYWTHTCRVHNIPDN